MATALFIKNVDTLNNLEFDQIPELPADDIDRYSNKYLLVLEKELDASIESLPETVEKILSNLCVNFNGVRIGVSEEKKGKVSLFAFVRSV